MKALKPLPINFWTSPRIIRCIKALNREGHDLTVRSIWQDKSKKTTKVLVKVLKVQTTGSRLYLAALRHLGSWDRALIESGLEVEAIRQKGFSWKKKTVSKVLKSLYESEVPLNAWDISRDRSHKTRDIIYHCTGHRKTGARLYQLGSKTIGHWSHLKKLSNSLPRSSRVTNLAL